MRSLTKASRRMACVPWRIVLVVGLCAGLGITACSKLSAPPNILIVLVDTLRTDRLGAYGNQDHLTPFLDGLAKRSYVFQNAYAQSSWTMPSVASLFTSRYQSQHGITKYNSVLAKAEFTLAEALEQHGYLTGGFSSNWGIRRDLGFGQGFKYFRAKAGEGQGFRQKFERATQTGIRLLHWLDQREPAQPAPVFLYLHVMNPHIPYQPPLIALKQAFAGGELPDLKAINDRIYEKDGPPFSDDEKVTIERLYDAEVISVDRALSALFAQLEERGLLDNSLIVFTADHGEEFWDHGSMGHGQSLYNELIHVPLFIHVPGQTARVDVPENVALIDIAPTLLDWIGGSPVESFEGRSVKPILQQKRKPSKRDEATATANDGIARNVIISELIQPWLREGPHERAIIINSHKLIVDVDGKKEFFDEENDAGEHKPDILPASDRKMLEQALDGFLAHVGKRATSETRPMDQETLEQLRALGYVK